MRGFLCLCVPDASLLFRQADGDGARYKLDNAQLTALGNVPWCDHSHGIRRHIWRYNYSPSASVVIVYYMNIQLQLNASVVIVVKCLQPPLDLILNLQHSTILFCCLSELWFVERMCSTQQFLFKSRLPLWKQTTLMCCSQLNAADMLSDVAKKKRCLA